MSAAGPKKEPDLSSMDLYDLSRSMDKLSNEIEELVGAPAVRVPSVNQCDGCVAGKPLDERGNHIMGDPNAYYRDLMRCQADRYHEGNAAKAALINERCDSIAKDTELGREGEDPEGPAGGLDLGGSSGCAGGLCEEEMDHGND